MKKRNVVWAAAGLCLHVAVLLLSPAVARAEDNNTGSETRVSTGVPPVPAAPQPLSDQKKEMLPLELVPPECVPSHLNTTDVDAQGNWMIKRAFWEQAERTHEKIMKVNTALFEQQEQFVKSRNESEKITDTAFRTLGFEQGQLKELIDQLSGSITAQREGKGSLDEEGRKIADQLKEQQRELEQLTIRLQAIAGIDEALDHVMEVLSQQLGACREFEKNSWGHFKEIGHELNDKKARILFYEMEGFLKNVEQNRDYVAKTLWQYMTESAEHLKKLLDELKSSVDKLKSKGLDLGKEFAQRRDKEAVERQKSMEDAQQKAQNELEQAKKREEACRQELNRTWWGRTKLFVADTTHKVGNMFASMWTSLKHLVGMK